MTAFATCMRLGRFGTNYGLCSTGSKGISRASYLMPSSDVASSTGVYTCSSSIYQYGNSHPRLYSQSVKSNGKPTFLVDTLALVRRLEEQGVPTKQAEVITAAISEAVNNSLYNISESVVSKAEMQKTTQIQESNLSKLKTETEILQENHFSSVQHETDKIRSDIDKLTSEFRYEIDKVTTGQQLHLNLETARIYDELTNRSAQHSNLTNKLDREIHTLRAQLEAAKYDVIKYCVGSLVSISAFSLTIVRFWHS